MDDTAIFVSGSCLYKEFNYFEKVAIGGYGAVVATKSRNYEISGGEKNTTNARMDLFGIIESLKISDPSSNIKIYLANKWVIDAVEKKWLPRWVKDGFKNVKHEDLWLIIYEQLKLVFKTGGHFSLEYIGKFSNVPNFIRAQELARSKSVSIFEKEFLDL